MNSIERRLLSFESRGSGVPPLLRLVLSVALFPSVVCFLVSCRQGSIDQPLERSAASASVSALILPPVEREFLWECEHRGNLLSQRGFAPLAAALRNLQLDPVRSVLAAGFQADVPDPSANNQVHWASLSIDQVQPSKSNRQPLHHEQFAQWLLGHFAGLSKSLKTCRFELITISPSSRENLDAVWHGRARLRVQGETEQHGPRELVVTFDFKTLAPALATLKNGGWLKEFRVEQLETRQAGQFLMREVAAERGFAVDALMDNWKCDQKERLVTTGGVYLCDFDRDAITDVLVTNEKSPRTTMFYRGLPDGKFQDVTYRIGLPDVLEARHAAFADIDGDGWEDLIFVGQAIYRNLAGEVFQDITFRTNLSHLVIAGGVDGITGMAVADYDNDGLVDFYVTRGDAIEFNRGSWIDGRSSREVRNQLLRNLGGGKFQDVTEVSGTSGNRRSVFTANWFDANDDGWSDLYMIHEFGPGLLLLNQRNGTFAEQQISEDSADFGSMGLATGDIDNDGDIDLFANNMYSKAGNRVMDNLPASYDAKTLSKLRRMVAGSQLHLNDGRAAFTPASGISDVAKLAWGWGAALVDLNNDGWLDIHATCGFMSQDRAKPDG